MISGKVHHTGGMHIPVPQHLCASVKALVQQLPALASAECNILTSQLKPYGKLQNVATLRDLTSSRMPKQAPNSCDSIYVRPLSTVMCPVTMVACTAQDLVVSHGVVDLQGSTGGCRRSPV